MSEDVQIVKPVLFSVILVVASVIGLIIAAYLSDGARLVAVACLCSAGMSYGFAVWGYSTGKAER